jgi:hypothetical protein
LFIFNKWRSSAGDWTLVQSCHDKKAVTFSPRHRMTHGRFKSSKSSTTVPGVDSTKR